MRLNGTRDAGTEPLEPTHGAILQLDVNQNTAFLSGAVSRIHAVS